MTNTELVGRCGLYCGACTIYRAERDDQEWRWRIAERYKIPAEKVRCQGCGALSPDCWGNECKFVKCLNGKGYKFCYECSEYESRSCQIFEEFLKNYLAEDGVDLRKNLAMIKAGEMDEWLMLSKEFYTCKYCGKPIVAGAKRCHHCKRGIGFRG